MRTEENRVLVVAPVGQDAAALAALLRGEGVPAEVCAGPGECLASLEGLAGGAGALLLTEEALDLPGAAALLESFRRQPAWSELPLIILTSGGESRFARLLEIAAEVAGGMTLLERPMRAGTLLHSVQVALRSRQRQYQVRDLLAERERFQTELERVVAERTAELRELVGELEHLSYSITHDMRAPLRAMLGFAEVAKELGAEGADHEQQLFLDRIQTAARRMDLLITDALSYSKAVRNELPLAPVDVGRLLRGMVDTYPELQDAQQGIRIEPELPLVLGNEAGLTQCFSNLLGNAVKFVRPGETPEIRVWAELRPPSPSHSQPESLSSGQLSTLSSSLSAPFVRIWVEDRGIGISLKMLPRVFDMFARGASQQAGTGIGLALVRKVVERMGGRVGVESEEGHGSRFWVELRSGEVRRRAGA